MADNQKSSFSPAQVKDIQAIVHNYLVTSPQVLIEASQALQKQEVAKVEQQAQGAIKANIKELFNDPNSPYTGNKNGDVMIVEFFDYQCGHCKAMEPIVAKLVGDNPKLKFIFKEFPIFGGNSDTAAKAALASMKQGKYYPFHNALLKAENPLSEDKIMQAAKSVGIDVDKLKKDMGSPEIAAQLKQNRQLATNLKLVGTPLLLLAIKQALASALFLVAHPLLAYKA